MKVLGAVTPRQLRELLNPKPVGETVNPHVHEAVKEPTRDYEKLNRDVRDVDFRKLIKPTSGPTR